MLIMFGITCLDRILNFLLSKYLVRQRHLTKTSYFAQISRGVLSMYLTLFFKMAKRCQKYKTCLHLGLYLGYLPKHFSTVSRILNTKLSHIRAQYHIVCDDNFSTVTSLETDSQNFSPTQWYCLVETGYEKTIDHLNLN